MPSRIIHSFAVLTVLLLGFSSSASAQFTRIEQDDPSITYSGNWYTNNTNAHSGGVAALTNTRGSRATIVFNGTGIIWLGVTDGWSGLANLFLDGKMQVIDTYGAGGYQQQIFAARDLAAGPHTLSIEVTHERDSHTDGSWVWIDAFLIENGAPVQGGVSATVGRVEENHPALVFAGRWYSNPSASHSGGNAALAMDAGSRVTVNFNGTGVRWIANRDEWSGMARIYIDGDLKTTVDTYLSPGKAQQVPYSIGDLSNGPHLLTIEATGTKNESAKGSWIWLDAFDVLR